MRKKTSRLTKSFCSESVWCSFWDIAICSMFYYQGFLDQYVLNRSGFHRSQSFQLIDFQWAGELCERSSHHVVTVFHLNIAHIENS